MTLDVFLRRRGPAAVLLGALLLEDAAMAAPPPAAPLSSVQQVARPTVTLPHRVLNVVPWPQPTEQVRLRGRVDDNNDGDEALNTICGYVGGNIDQPATCMAGSHCVLDAEHGAVGCCPNGAAACTAGVFTGCVDGTAAAQQTAAVVNPYVYTCSGADVCYRNTFAGGYFQYGCAAASVARTLVHDVAVTAAGHSAALQNQRVSFTGAYATATRASSLPSTLPSSSTSSTSSSSTSSSSTSSSTTSSSISSSSSPHNTAASFSAATSTTNHHDHRVGVIAGATVGSVVGLLALLALLAFCLVRRRRAARKDAAGRMEEKDLFGPYDAPPAYGWSADTKTGGGSFGSLLPVADRLPVPVTRRPVPAPASAGGVQALHNGGADDARKGAGGSTSSLQHATAAAAAAAYRGSMISSAGSASRLSRLSRMSRMSLASQLSLGDGGGDAGWNRSAAAHMRTLSYPPPGSYRQLSPYGDYPALPGSEADNSARATPTASAAGPSDQDHGSRHSSQSYHSADDSRPAAAAAPGMERAPSPLLPRPLVLPTLFRPATSDTLWPGGSSSADGPAWV